MSGAVLTREIVLDIFRYKIENVQAVESAVSRHASMLAGMYGVSEKTIRDIWTARTWSEETSILEPTRRTKSGSEQASSRNRAGGKSGRGEDRLEQVEIPIFSPLCKSWGARDQFRDQGSETARGYDPSRKNRDEEVLGCVFAHGGGRESG